MIKCTSTFVFIIIILIICFSGVILYWNQIKEHLLNIEQFNVTSSTAASTRPSTTAPSTTAPTTTETPTTTGIPTTTKSPEQIQAEMDAAVYAAQLAIDQQNTGLLYGKIAKFNKNIEKLNKVAAKDAKVVYDADEMKRSFATAFSNNTDVLLNNIVDQAKTVENDAAQINSLKDQITDLESIVNKMNLKKKANKNYTKIKSLNNGLELNLIDQLYTDDVIKSEFQGYQVNFNDGCLSVGQKDYDVYQCDPANKKQQFKMVHVLNDLMYSNNIDKLLPFTTIDTSKTQYPFTLIKSVNNDNCLTNNHGTVTVQPCSTLISQRWLPVDDKEIE
jgi:hypothetical protein